MPPPPDLRRRIVLAVLLVVGALLAVSCGSPSDRTTVMLGDDAWTVLLAGRDGMRGREGFDGADGMLFDLGGPTDPSAVVFVMDRVTLPLDIGWFAEDGDFLGWAKMLVCEAAPCPRYQAPGPFRWAIEAPPGAFDDLSPGVRLEISP